MVKNLPAMWETWVWSPGVGNGNPLQYSCLGNLMDRGAWRATVHGVTKRQTRLTAHTHTFLKREMKMYDRLKYMIKQQQRSLWNFREWEDFKSYLKKYNDEYVNSPQDTRCFHVNYELQKTTKKEQVGMKVNTTTTTTITTSLQSCPTLCDPTDGSPPGSPVPGILQTRTLKWVAISFSNAWKWKVKVKSLLATPWTAAYEAPPSMGFSRWEYWSGLPLPSPMKVNRYDKKEMGEENKDFMYSLKEKSQTGRRVQHCR